MSGPVPCAPRMDPLERHVCTADPSTAGAESHSVPTGQRLRGRAGYRALAATWLNAFEDGLVETVSLRELDDGTARSRTCASTTKYRKPVLGGATGRRIKP